MKKKISTSKSMKKYEMGGTNPMSVKNKTVGEKSSIPAPTKPSAIQAVRNAVEKKKMGGAVKKSSKKK